MDLQELADRIALKELVDSVSILGDKKDLSPRCSYMQKMQRQKLMPEVYPF